MRSKFDSNPEVPCSNPTQWIQYYFLLTIRKNKKSYREEASTRYWHIHKTDSTDGSVGRAEDCSVISKFDSNP